MRSQPRVLPPQQIRYATNPPLDQLAPDLEERRQSLHIAENASPELLRHTPHRQHEGNPEAKRV